MRKLSRNEAVATFHENTKDLEVADQIVGGVFALFIRNFLAYSYAINEVADRIAEDGKAYRFGIKHTCKHIESEGDKMVSLMRTTYNIKHYQYQMQDIARLYFDAIARDLEMVRMQVWQVFTRYQETHRVLLSYIFTAMFIADWAQKQWAVDVSEVERILYVNRKLMSVNVDTRRLFNPLKVDGLVHDLRKLADAFSDKGGGTIDLNDDRNVMLAKKIFFNKLDNRKIIDEAIDKAGFGMKINKDKQ